MPIAENTHFYDREGLPAYEVPYADPTRGMRATTLRDAKVNKYLPSVTSILNIPAKPGLDRWKQNQLLDAAWACPVEDEKGYKLAVVEMAGMKSDAARIKGTEIHAAVENYYESWPHRQPSGEYKLHIANVISELNKYYPVSEGFVPERSFAHKLGYGGKVDLSYQAEDCINGVVIDFKTKDFTEDADPKKLAYPEMAMQLDAYRHGLKMPNALMVNVFIDRESGIVKLHEWKEGTYFEQFKCLLKFWQLSKSYDSSFEA